MVFVWTIGSAMDWRDKDYQALTLKKGPTLIYKAYYFRTAIRHECPVQRSLNSYSYGRFGSGGDCEHAKKITNMNGRHLECFKEVHCLGLQKFYGPTKKPKKEYLYGFDLLFF